MLFIPIIKSMESNALCQVLLKRHNLENPKKGQFYPVNQYLSLLNELDKRMPTLLRHAGEHICVEVDFPPHTTFDQILMVTDQAYQNGHRGHSPDEIGHYLCEKKSESEYWMTVTDPYPCNIDIGIFNGYAKKFKTRINIDHMGNACRRKGDPECIYRVQILD